jgi:glycine/D-amino acid oxidase-like deaminating enzyme
MFACFGTCLHMHTTDDDGVRMSCTGCLADVWLLCLINATGSSREFAGWETVKQERVVDAIMERAVQFLPELKTTPADTRVGLRPYAVAGAPTVGWVPGLPGIMVAAGHEGSGLCLGPGTADVVVGLLERAR